MLTGHYWPEVGRSIRDVRHLLWFRAATVRRRRAVGLAMALLVLATIAAATLPAWLSVEAGLLHTAALALPAALTAVALVSLASAVSGGGGREVLARDPASIHPISPVSDHLGALALAPLNAGWLIQTWALLAFSAMVAGPTRLLPAQLLTVTWVVAVTVVAQAVGWAVEWVRRGPRGVRIVRVALGITTLTLGAIGATPGLRGVLVSGPASAIANASEGGGAAGVVSLLIALAVVTITSLALGARLAELTARRVPRDEARLESRVHPARTASRSDLAAMRRIDRASIWRSVPLRRGTLLLALGPGAVALTGGLAWDTLILLPGLVASGCAMLFAVNMWCLDGRGMLWRETLPVRPRQVLIARSWVLAEVLLGAGLTTILLGAVRAGAPTASELMAALLVLLTGVGQTLSASLRWSSRAPHAVDLRSARATPAPPLAMVGYSLRLAMTTTLSGLAFAAFGTSDRPDLLLGLAAILLVISGLRIRRSARRWDDPVRRSSVVAVVAA